MNESKHTPGPWEVGALLGDPDGNSYEYPTFYHIDSIKGKTYVADIMGALSPEAMPNARLIAAAPDLLEALMVLTNHAQETYPHFEDVRGQADIAAALAAIVKAKGE
jgi:hypothetical protein